MAAYPKIADNEMNYFQFKARQMLLLKKEDREWHEFCKQVAPECVACVAEKRNVKECIDIGIQANFRTPFKRLERPSLQSKKKNEQIPETLNDIKVRLENLDLALSKIYNMPDENEKIKEKHKEASVLKNVGAQKLFEEERRHFIQNSLKTSLEKLESSPHKVTKKPAIKPKNSSYFLPHDLQVKRAAARKAYLASLQTKPKVSFQNERQITKESAQRIQNIKRVSKHSPKSKKKVVPKNTTKSSNVEKETLIASIEIDEAKDENIEFVVDAILDDLLLEAGLDLNKIKKRKIEFNKLKQKMLLNKERETDHPSGSLTFSPVKTIVPKPVVYGGNSSITKLRLFSNPSTKLHECENEQTELLLEETKKKTSIFHPEFQKHVAIENIGDESDTQFPQPKLFFEIKDPPKFVCNILHSITINSEIAKRITQNKERYWRYLKNISRTVKGNINPLVLNNTLAESILDDCINDIAEEIDNTISMCVKEVYNQEFIQQVEK